MTTTTTSTIDHRPSHILILGAGPAGMATALFLAKKGIRSTLIEKETFPRDKICGDGLSGWVISMLHKLDLGLVDEIRSSSEALDSWGITFYAPNMKHITLPYVFHKRPDEPPGYVIKRKLFDDLLASKVREEPLITFQTGCKIIGYQWQHAGLPDEQIVLISEDQQTFSGELVVVSNGANSKVARELGVIPKQDRHWATGIKTYYSGIPANPNNPVEFYFLKNILPGYLWIFPLPNGEANVGLGIRTDILKKKKIHLQSVLFEEIKNQKVLRDRFAGAKQIAPTEAWGLPLGSQKRSLSGNRFLLAGDAASLIDPFTGEGVGNALNSGFHAAEHIADCLQSQRFDAVFNKQYDQRVYDKLWKELHISAVIQKLLVYPALINWVMNRTTKSKYLESSLIRMIDDLEERKKLKSPWFYFRLLAGR